MSHLHNILYILCWQCNTSTYKKQIIIKFVCYVVAVDAREEGILNTSFIQHPKLYETIEFIALNIN